MFDMAAPARPKPARNLEQRVGERRNELQAHVQGALCDELVGNAEQPEQGLGKHHGAAAEHDHEPEAEHEALERDMPCQLHLLGPDGAGDHGAGGGVQAHAGGHEELVPALRYADARNGAGADEARPNQVHELIEGLERAGHGLRPGE
jgi:hypothetical protein